MDARDLITFHEENEDLMINEVFEMLTVLDAVDLHSVTQRLQLDVNSSQKGSKSFLLRLILRYLNSTEVDQMPDNGLSIFRDLHESIKRILNPEKPSREKFGTTYIKDSRRISSSSNPFKAYTTQPAAASTPYPSQQFKDMSLEDNTFWESREEGAQNPVELNDRNQFFKSFPVQKIREFKISGSIGNPEQKDKLSFTSLSYQINNGLKQGYPHAEIAGAVIKAINPGNPLRAYLEGRAEITMKQLLKILRSHFREQNATTLFTELTNGAQGANESVQEFAVRLMSLRQKVLMVSQEEESPYSENLVMTRFLNALSTGIRNPYVRTEMKPILKPNSCLVNPEVSDEEILGRLNEVVSEENEHQNKLRKRTVDTHEMSGEVSQSQKEGTLKVLTEINALKTQMEERFASVNRDFTALKNTFGNASKPPIRNNPDPNQTSDWFPQCVGCRKSNYTGRCNHCFRCGSESHMRFDCPELNVVPKN